jgi:hypothetical protein
MSDVDIADLSQSSVVRVRSRRAMLLGAAGSRITIELNKKVRTPTTVAWFIVN